MSKSQSTEGIKVSKAEKERKQTQGYVLINWLQLNMKTQPTSRSRMFQDYSSVDYTELLYLRIAYVRKWGEEDEKSRQCTIYCLAPSLPQLPTFWSGCVTQPLWIFTGEEYTLPLNLGVVEAAWAHLGLVRWSLGLWAAAALSTVGTTETIREPSPHSEEGWDSQQCYEIWQKHQQLRLAILQAI